MQWSHTCAQRLVIMKDVFGELNAIGERVSNSIVIMQKLLLSEDIQYINN